MINRWLNQHFGHKIILRSYETNSQYNRFVLSRNLCDQIWITILWVSGEVPEDYDIVDRGYIFGKCQPNRQSTLYFEIIPPPPWTTWIAWQSGCCDDFDGLPWHLSLRPCLLHWPEPDTPETTPEQTSEPTNSSHLQKHKTGLTHEAMKKNNNWI